MSPTEDWICDKLEMKHIWDALKNCPEEHVPAFPSATKIKRDKRLLVRKLIGTGPYWTDLLLSLANGQNATYKSRQRATRVQHTKNQRIERHESAFTTPAGGYLDLPTKEQYVEIYKAFYDSMSNQALAESVCAVCARRMNTVAGRFSRVRLLDLPNRLRLKPITSHKAHIYTDGCLLEKAGCFWVESETWIDICHDCHTDLKKPTHLPPKYSLANNLWVGLIPRALRRLTMAEHLLIALVYPRVFVVKLFPKHKGGQHLPEDQIQHALRGNVTSFEVNRDDMVDMVAGKLMPQPISVLSKVLSITFVGRGKKPNPAALDIFRVRRDNIRDALIWLKENNPKYYGSIKIDDTRLNQLPINDVPDEVKLNMRQEEDDSVVHIESAGYTPVDESNPGEEELSQLPNDDEGIYGQPDIVPLQYLGVMDNEGSRITSQDILASGLSNLLKKCPSSEAYAIRHGAPTNTFGQPPLGRPVVPDRGNHWERAFPVLYPYGIGGIESDRPTKISFIDHVRWSLLHYDRRFRYHETFIFSAFSIQQRRQALMSAKLLTQRKDYPSVEQAMQGISLKDLEKAAQEERSNLKVSNPAVRLLKDKVTAIARRIMGSNAARAQLRSQIVSTSLYLNPPALWITINPDDIHDPVAQIFAGEEINMDDFAKTAGPSPSARMENIARDPFAAAKFFNFTVTTILEKLFRITATPTRIHSDSGVLGRVQAYFGTVECQGRGTLHLHMLLWLHGSPPPREMKQKLLTEEFRLKIAAYLKANIRTYLSELHTPAHLSALPINSQVAYSRSPNPSDSPSLDQFFIQLRRLEVEVVRSKQMHKCDENRCTRFDQYGREYCKRRAPWDLSEDYVVSADGTYQTKRTLGYLNGYCPSLAVALKSNHDIKLLSYGAKSTGIAFYCTKYMVKGEGRSHNTSSLLSKGMIYYYDNNSKVLQLRKNQDDLIWKAFNVLNREQEVPASMIITHLMGYGDSYKSHQYSPIFLGAFVSFICKTYKELSLHSTDRLVGNLPEQPTGMLPGADSGENVRTTTETSDPREDEVVLLQFDQNGQARPSSQIDDYMYRSDKAEDYSVLNYLVGTYESKVTHKQEAVELTEDIAVQEELLPIPTKEPLDYEPSDKTTPSGAQSNSRGRPAHERIYYNKSHSRHDTHIRIIRPPQHSTLPNFIGPPFPRASDPDQADRHAAFVLMLLKPWRHPRDLKADGQTWADALDSFMKICDPKSRDMIDNIEHYHACKIAAEEGEGVTKVVEESHLIDDEYEIEDIGGDFGPGNGIISSNAITAEMVAEARKEGLNAREMAHGLHAIRIGESRNVFQAEKCNIKNRASVTTLADVELLKLWQSQLQQGKASSASMERNLQAGNGQGTDIVTLQSLNTTLDAPRVEVLPEPIHEESLSPVSSENLRPDQKRAFEIVNRHLSQYISSQHRPDVAAPSQLLMLLTGQGGTGKSRVIQTITEAFKNASLMHILIKSAFTGIAASLIDGKTTHHIASIPVGNRNQTLSAEAKRKLGLMWKDIQYLIIDEYSMLSKEFLARLSRNITVAKMEYDTTIRDLPFGGVNVILCGDLHQFPPVAVSANGALFHQADPKRDRTNTDAQYGRAIYERFTTVVTLTEQVRASDPVWRAFLDRLRIGQVTDEDVGMLRTLTLTDPRCRSTDFTSQDSDMKDCCLITPRHAVRTQWNDAAVLQHCQRTGAQLYICPAKDVVHGKKGQRPLALHEKYVAAKSARGNKQGLGLKNGLPDEVALAIGLKVMVTLNVETDLDVANGARGSIVGIALSPDEPPFDPDAETVTLQEPPAYILVKMERTRAVGLKDLAHGVIPIVPASKTYRIVLPVRQENGEVTKVSRTIRRTQLPITPAYAFTDYRSQGQTIPAAIVDIATPPTGGGLTLANIYVALSRSSGQNTIRILRDFDETIMLKPVDYDLVKEDERLEKLNEETKRWWEQIANNK